MLPLLNIPLLPRNSPQERLVAGFPAIINPSPISPFQALAPPSTSPLTHRPEQKLLPYDPLQTGQQDVQASNCSRFCERQWRSNCRLSPPHLHLVSLFSCLLGDSYSYVVQLLDAKATTRHTGSSNRVKPSNGETLPHDKSNPP